MAQLRIAAAIEALSNERLKITCDNYFGKEPSLQGQLKFTPRRLRQLIAVGLHRAWSRGVPSVLGSFDLRTVAIYKSGLAAEINRSSYDIVHLHWVGDGVLSIEEIGEIEKPIIWTFHDMWPLGGAQHYPSTSKQGDSWFGRVGLIGPGGLKSWVVNSIDRSVRRRKKRSWKRPISAVSPSQWLLNHIAEDDIFSAMPRCRIPNPISIPAPVDSTQLNGIGGGKSNELNLLFVSSSGISDPRKGWSKLPPTICALKDLLPLELFEKLNLTIVGEGSPPKEVHGIRVNHLGHLSQEQLAEVYRSASLTVLPSSFDNFPNVALESMSYGTPVIGSAGTGIAEILSHGVDGFSVDWEDANSAAALIAPLLLDQNKLREFRRQCVRTVSEKFTDQVVGAKYLEVYRSAFRSDGVA